MRKLEIRFFISFCVLISCGHIILRDYQSFLLRPNAVSAVSRAAHYDVVIKSAPIGDNEYCKLEDSLVEIFETEEEDTETVFGKSKAFFYAVIFDFSSHLNERSFIRQVVSLKSTTRAFVVLRALRI